MTTVVMRTYLSSETNNSIELGVQKKSSINIDKTSVTYFVNFVKHFLYLNVFELFGCFRNQNNRCGKYCRVVRVRHAFSVLITDNKYQI